MVLNHQCVFIINLKFKSNKIIRFGYVGGNTKIKGIHLILEAFRQYCFDNTELIIVDNLLNLGERSYCSCLYAR